MERESRKGKRRKDNKKPQYFNKEIISFQGRLTLRSNISKSTTYKTVLKPTSNRPGIFSENISPHHSYHMFFCPLNLRN